MRHCEGKPPSQDRFLERLSLPLISFSHYPRGKWKWEEISAPKTQKWGIIMPQGGVRPYQILPQLPLLLESPLVLNILENFGGLGPRPQ